MRYKIRNMNVAVLLTVHNRREKTLACLEKIYKQQLPACVSVDTYLTDDGCTDGTREAVRMQFPQVHIIDGDGSLFWNRGMIAAWNAAAESDYDFYLWLNDDTFIYNDVLKRLLECSERHNDCAIVVGTTCALNDVDTITYGGVRNGKLVTDISKEQKCTTFNGNIVLVPKNVYKLLGTNDHYYRHSLGDYDYGLTATECDIDIWIAQGIMGECSRHERPTVWMDSSQSFSMRWKNFFSPVGNNPFEFFHFRKKHFGKVDACKTFVSNFAHFLFPRFWDNISI